MIAFFPKMLIFVFSEQPVCKLFNNIDLNIIDNSSLLTTELAPVWLMLQNHYWHKMRAAITFGQFHFRTVGWKYDIKSQFKNLKQQKAKFKANKPITGLKGFMYGAFHTPLNSPKLSELWGHTKGFIKCCQMLLMEKTQTHTCLNTAQ